MSFDEEHDHRMKKQAVALTILTLLTWFVTTLQAQEGQATGMKSMWITCYNLSKGQIVSGTLPDSGRFDCQALGLTVNPGHKVRVSVYGAADDLPVTLFAPEIDPVDYVQCQNRRTDDEFVRRGTSAAGTDCRSLPAQNGEKLSIAMRGTYNPPLLVCPCFDAARIDHLIGVLESFAAAGGTTPQCVAQPDYAEWLARGPTAAAGPELLFMANARSASRCSALLVDPYRRTLVQDALQITPAEFQACRNLLAQRCSQQ
jgi:hypothetical protein